MTIIELPSPNHGPRPDGTRPDILLVHYTGMPTAADALSRLCAPAGQVSAHYTIDEDGTVYRHVPEHRRAWHAGRGCWRGDRDINSRSIGIELVNPGHEFGYRPFSAVQMDAFIDLAVDVMARHNIAPENVLGHSDIACARKEDPGELFDWPGLARHGIGLWPEPTAQDKAGLDLAAFEDIECRALLTRYGYDPDLDFGVILTAFQRHFHPECLGQPLRAETLSRLRTLVRVTGR